MTASLDLFDRPAVPTQSTDRTICFFCGRPGEVEDRIPKERLARTRDFVFYRCSEHPRGFMKQAINRAQTLCEVSS